jgi:Domain of unknown function (DUF3598)
LESFDNNQTARLTLARQGQSDLIREFTSLGKSTLFFENGAFCQGSIQLAPFTEFGAELAFIHENRRLRLVQLYDHDSQLNSITLIREHKEGTEVGKHPQLTVEALLGEWQGEAVTIYPDLRPADTLTTKLQLQLDDSGRLVANQIYGNKTITSTASINGSVILFDQNPQNLVQVLLLPDGASAVSPLKAQLGKPLFLEAGWLIEANIRQRMTRSYNEKGEWTSLTLLTEYRG